MSIRGSFKEQGIMEDSASDLYGDIRLGIRPEYSTVIIGAGIIGAATAYYLAEIGHTDILIVEMDVPCSGSTGRCIGGVRQQFSDELNIKIAMQSVACMKKIQTEKQADIQFLQDGYLLLAYNEAQEDLFKTNIKLQKSLGLNVSYIQPDEISKRFPNVNTKGLFGGAWCPDDGQANPFLLVNFFITNSLKKGVQIIKNASVTALLPQSFNDLEKTHDKVNNFEVEILKRIRVKCDRVINCAGPWAGEVAKMAGLDIPVWPERHESLVTEKIAPILKPMLVDYTKEHGCYFQQKENGAIIGCYTPTEPLKGFDLGVSFTFLKEMSSRMLRLVPELADVSVVRHWSGHYTETPDGKPIIGPVKNMPAFINIVGFCGHGLMQGPRVGQLMAEYIVDGTTSLDISSLCLERFENVDLQALEKEKLH